jgi:hypothetical protein
MIAFADERNLAINPAAAMLFARWPGEAFRTIKLRVRSVAWPPQLQAKQHATDISFGHLLSPARG